MRRIIILTTLLLSVSAYAQTTIDITSQAPASTVCAYPTDHVATGSTPGHLAARLTGTPSGAGCVIGGGGIAGVSFGPASPLLPNIPSLSGGTAAAPNVAASFTAQPVNAVSCSAAIATTVGLGNGTLTGGASVCTSAATCSSGTPLNIAATFNNPSNSATSTYIVTLTCNAAVGAIPPATASSVTVTQQPRDVLPPLDCPTIIPGSTTGIPNFTQFTGIQPVSYFSTSANVDVTSFDALYQAPWPGNSSLTAVVTLPTNKYVSAKFHVPAGYMAGYTGTGLYGDYTVNQSGFSASVSMSISRTCGDFAQPGSLNPTTTVVPGCWVNKKVTGGFVQWRKDSTCILNDNTDYYLNYINADVSGIRVISGNTAGGTASSTKNANCGSSCTDPIANNPGSWTSYTFP